jgi:hypothetical protein
MWPISRRPPLASKAGAATALYVLGKLPHGLLGDGTAFSARKCCFRFIDRRQDFHSRALALLPQGKSLLDGVFFRHKPSAVDGAAD